MSGGVCAAGGKMGPLVWLQRFSSPEIFAKGWKFLTSNWGFLFAGLCSDKIGCSSLENPIPAQLRVKEKLLSALFGPGYPGNAWLENGIGGNRGMEQKCWHREVPVGHTPRSILAASKPVEAQGDPKVLAHTEPWSWDEDVGSLHG